MSNKSRCHKCHEVHDATWTARDCWSRQQLYKRMAARARLATPRVATGPDGRMI